MQSGSLSTHAQLLSPAKSRRAKSKSPAKSGFASKRSNTPGSFAGGNSPGSAHKDGNHFTIKNPFLVQKKKKSQKRKGKLAYAKSFDERLKAGPKAKERAAGAHFATSIEGDMVETQIKQERSGSLPDSGILRHRSWKKVRRSAYSMAMKEKRPRLDNSDNSTVDSLKLNNKFNRSGNSRGEEQSEVGADTGRRDQFKNPIIRGKKRHKVSFARKSRTFVVENWKELNLKMTAKVNKNRGCFVCSVF